MLTYILAYLMMGTTSLTDTLEDIFQQKSRIIINQTAENYTPPSMSIGDPEKYYWPKTIARFEKYDIMDSTGNAFIKALKDNSPFHFTLVGMARLMSKYPEAPAIVKHKTLILTHVFSRNDSHNAWTAEGTENHINMCRTSGYLFAQEALAYPDLFPEAPDRLQQMKSWIKNWSKRIFEVGVGEWHSGIYETYNLMGWLNLFDFAQDEEVKSIAKAVLDYYAIEMALFYSYGIPGGSEMRGSGITQSTFNATNYLAWLWYGPENYFPFALKGNQYIQCMHATTSGYRPPVLAVLLAQKSLTKPAYYQNSKPTYLLNQSSFVKQPFYIGKNFTLGSQISQYGGWTGASYQIVNWKLVIDTQVPANPEEISGNGLFWKNYWGKTRDPWTQYMQFQNIMIQLTSLPENAEQIYEEIEQVAITWNEKWKHDFLLRYPSDREKNVYHKPKQLHFENKSFLNIPNNTTLLEVNGMLLAEINEVFLKIQPIHQLDIKQNRIDGRILLLDSAKRGSTCGFIVEVVDAELYQDVESFKNAAMNVENMIVENHNITYYSLSGQKIDIEFEQNGHFREPLYDWGYGTTERHTLISSPPFRGPDWPSGKNFGRIPKLWVNEVLVDHSLIWPVFSGPNLMMNKGILRLNSGESYYEVDYSGELPVFKNSFVNLGHD